MAAPNSVYLKELNQLARNVNKLTSGQARIEVCCDNESEFFLFITPNDGYYKGATCHFKVLVPERYPQEAPYVTCLNNIYHPNIDIGQGVPASICVSLLDSDWQPGLSLDWCVMAVLFLFHHPNPEDALSPAFQGNAMPEDEFAANVRTSLRGEKVEGFYFDQLINENLKSDEENILGDNVGACSIDENNLTTDKYNHEENEHLDGTTMKKTDIREINMSQKCSDETTADEQITNENGKQAHKDITSSQKYMDGMTEDAFNENKITNTDDNGQTNHREVESLRNLIQNKASIHCEHNQKDNMNATSKDELINCDEQRNLPHLIMNDIRNIKCDGSVMALTNMRSNCNIF